MSDNVKCCLVCLKYYDIIFIEYYDLVNVPKITVASLNTTQVAVTFTINTEQVTTHNTCNTK